MKHRIGSERKLVMEYSRSKRISIALLAVLAVPLAATASLASSPQCAVRPVYFLGAFGTYTFQGLRVDLVVPGSPADLQVGLEPGDRIVRINGRLIRNQSDFVNIVNASGGYARLLIRNVRDGGYVAAGVYLDGGPCIPYPQPYQGRIRRDSHSR